MLWGKQDLPESSPTPALHPSTLGADSPGPINAVPAEAGASYMVFFLLQTPDLQSGCITLPES